MHRYVIWSVLGIVVAIGVFWLRPKQVVAPFENLPVSWTMHTQTWSIATFAAGCFRCIEPAFQTTTGVLDAIVGYAWWSAEDATYDRVSSGRTKHKEAIQVFYDPTQITYADLLRIFRSHIDPTDPDGQFVDKGPQYTTVIYYHNLEQYEIALASKAMEERSGKYDKPIVTEIIRYTTFFPAEEYHQDFWLHSAERYNWYKKWSGREEYFDEITDKEIISWAYTKPDEATLRATLTPEQFEVTQACSTEPPFANEYRDNHRAGIYVDIVSGQPLFSSLDKFDSGSWRPSFTKPITWGVVAESLDISEGMVRIEAKSSAAWSHLGHIFDDGPAASGGMRYCINSSSMKFIPVEDLEKEGYGERKYLFTK
jgi:peptide methionine sulfoxide reductase msrA/msrB